MREAQRILQSLLCNLRTRGKLAVYDRLHPHLLNPLSAERNAMNSPEAAHPLGEAHGSARRYVSFRTMSEDPNDFCEDCHDTGYAGDNGPGIRENREYVPCECNFIARNKRKIARRPVPQRTPELSDGANKKGLTDGN